MNWDEMFAQRDTLEAEARRKAKAKKVERMHVLYGKREDARCRDCVSFISRQFAKTYHKCERYGVTGGPGTDWNGRSVACGKFESRGQV